MLLLRLAFMPGVIKNYGEEGEEGGREGGREGGNASASLPLKLPP
jgi:hypothetical protein